MNDTTFHLFGSTFCCMVICTMFAAGAGLYGASRARKLGAPGRGPQLIAGSVALLAAASLAQLLLMIATSATTLPDLYPLFSVLALLLFTLEAAAVAGVAAGIWLIRPLPRGDEASS